MRASKAKPNRNPAVVALSLAVSVAVFCAVFMWNPPAPRYHPLEHVWRMPGNAAPGPAMGWYGRTGAALLPASAAGCMAALALRSRDRQNQLVLRAPLIYAIALLMAFCLLSSVVQLVREQRTWFAKPSAASPKQNHEY